MLCSVFITWRPDAKEALSTLRTILWAMSKRSCPRTGVSGSFKKMACNFCHPTLPMSRTGHKDCRCDQSTSNRVTPVAVSSMTKRLLKS